MLPKSNMDVLKAMWSQTDKALEQYRYPDQDSFKNSEKQIGKGMWHTELVSRVLKMNPALWVEESLSSPGNMAFYCRGPEGKKFTNAVFNRGYVPEFSIIATDAADLPVSVKYGWRTVLLRLMKQGLLTQNHILTMFGDVHHADERGKHWAIWFKDVNPKER